MTTCMLLLLLLAVACADTPPRAVPEGEQEVPETEVDYSDSVILSDACTEAISSVCQLSGHYSFEESLRCLESHVSELQGACSIALNVMMSNLLTDCGATVSSLCPSGTNNDESVYVLSCLSNHQSELSTECQKQFDSYLNEEYPCSKEASIFCSEGNLSPEQTLSCLETTAAVSPEEISLECATILDGFSICKEDDGPLGKPKPKPKAAARARLLSTDGSSRDDKPKPKPKPEPKSKPKPPPPDSEDGSGGKRRKCWRFPDASTNADSSSGGADSSGSGFLGFEDLGFDTKNEESDSNDVDVVVISMGAVLSLVAVLVVGMKYRQRQEEVDSRGGYWRAPSIQAMLYDDSTHSSSSGNGSGNGSSERIVMGSVVEMDDLSKSGDVLPRADGVAVTLSPITHSDEIRV